MDVAHRLSWGNVYQEIEKMCTSNSLVQAGKVIAEKLDQAVGDWLDPDACVSVAEPLAGCQNDSLSDDEALKSVSDQINSIKELASYISPTGACGVSESSHREDMWNNMHVLDLKSEDFQDVDLHDSWEDDDEDYDLVLASYHEPRKMSCKKKVVALFISKLRMLSHYKKAGTSCRDLNAQKQRARGVRSSSDSDKGSNRDLESEWELL